MTGTVSRVVKRSKRLMKKSTDEEARSSTLVDVPRDGNCLFSCICVATFKSNDAQMTNLVRKTAVQYIISNWDDFKETVVVHNTPTKEEYGQECCFWRQS